MSDSTTRHQFDGLFSLYAAVAAAVFVLVCAALALILIRYRASRGHDPSRQSSSSRLELGYAVALAVIAGLLVWRSFLALDREDAAPRAVASLSPAAAAAAGHSPPVRISAVAAQWDWHFDYGGGVVQTGSRPMKPAELVVPAGQPVRFRLTSRDVVHSFWIPAQRTKYDAIPGRVNAFTMTFERGVDYSGSRCSEFCGTYHDQMVFDVRVLAPAQFAAWLKARRQEAAR